MQREGRNDSTSAAWWVGGAAAITALALLCAASGAISQPSHQPGAICYTREGWCFAQPPGAPGSACACPTPHGLVPGVRG